MHKRGFRYAYNNLEVIANSWLSNKVFQQFISKWDEDYFHIIPTEKDLHKDLGMGHPALIVYR